MSITTEPSGAPLDLAPAWRRLRRVALGSFWLIGGIAVILYALLLVYGLLTHIEIDSAVVGGAVEPLKAPADGRVDAFTLAAGDTFGAGSTLFRVENPDLAQAIGLQRVTVQRADNDLTLAQATLAAERARRDDWVSNQRFEIDKSAALIADLAAEDQQLTTRCAEYTELLKRGWTETWRLHDAEDKQAAARQGLSQARVLLKQQEAQLRLALSGQGFGGVEVIGQLAEATEAVAHARTERALSADTLNILLRRQAQAADVAPGPGRVLRILRMSGSQVQAGDAVAVVERDARRFIYAYMTQGEIGRVAIGDAVDVYLPAQRKYARARVTAIERAGAYLDDVQTRYDWRANRDNPQRMTDRDRTARVTLVFEGNAAELAADVGTPVVVAFTRRWDEFLPRFSAFADERH